MARGRWNPAKHPRGRGGKFKSKGGGGGGGYTGRLGRDGSITLDKASSRRFTRDQKTIRRSATVGGVVGALTGSLAGPQSSFVGAALGAGIGANIGNARVNRRNTLLKGKKVKRR